MPTGRSQRSHWHPVAAVTELGAHPVKAVDLLGEELVLFRTSERDYGLLGRHCPHRLADLSYGWTEDRGIRCIYHGWLFDATGRCLQQPYEDTVDPGSVFRDRVRATAYPTAVRAGLIWAYLGPPPAPPLPDPDRLDPDRPAPEADLERSGGAP